MFVSLVILFSAGIFAGQSCKAWAEDAKVLLTQANKVLRQAKKDMFAGKNDKAIASLDNIKKLIIKAKELDPNNSRIKSIENKYKKLVKDLERRTGKDLGGGTVAAAGVSAKTKLPPKPTARAMPPTAPKAIPAPATVALEWFNSSTEWGKRSKEPRKPLAVVVTGPWSIQKKNILGEPIMYGLPIYLAVQVDSDKDLNAARVYILTMRTVEKRGVKMEPPFDHITVGNSYFIRPDKVK